MFGTQGNRSTNILRNGIDAGVDRLDELEATLVKKIGECRSGLQASRLEEASESGGNMTRQEEDGDDGSLKKKKMRRAWRNRRKMRKQRLEEERQTKKQRRDEEQDDGDADEEGDGDDGGGEESDDEKSGDADEEGGGDDGGGEESDDEESDDDESAAKPAVPFTATDDGLAFTASFRHPLSNSDLQYHSGYDTSFVRGYEDKKGKPLYEYRFGLNKSAPRPLGSNAVGKRPMPKNTEVRPAR